MKHALIVGDKEENLLYLRALLESESWAVNAAQHGVEALVKARQSPPDLVISDLLMPVMDGFTLLRHWKADPRLRQATFIVHTSTYTDPEDEHLAMSLGADAFIPKPIAPEDFLARLREVRANAAGPAPGPIPPSVSEGDRLLQTYNAALIRKLEEKSRQLEAANRALQSDNLARLQTAGRLGAILDALPAHIALLDPQGVIQAVNDAWRRFATANALHGPDFAVGHNYLAVCERAAGDDAEVAQAAAGAIRRVLRGELPIWSIEYPCHSPDEQRWFRMMVTPLAGDEGAGAVVMHLNITEHRRAEAARLESQRMLEALVETAPSLIVLTDHQGRIILFNRACEELTGYSSEEVLGKTIAELFLPPEWVPVVAKRFANPNAPEVRQPHQNPWRAKSGELRVIEWRCTPMVSPADGASFILGIGTDITDRLLAAESLAASKTHLATAQRVARIGSWELDLAVQTDVNANELRWSDEMFRLAGYEPGAVDVTNELFFRLVHPDDHAAIRQAVADAIRERRQYSVVHRLIRPDGEERIVREVADILYDGRTGAPVKMVGIMHDITEQQHSERQVTAFAALGRKLGDAATASEAARIIMETARDLFGWDACWLHLYDMERDRVLPVLNMDLVDGQRREVPPAYADRPPSPGARRAMEEGPQLILRTGSAASAGDLVPYGDMARPSASLIIVPVRHRGRVIAVMSIQSYAPNAYRREHLAGLEALADHCGAALAQIRAHEALRQSEARFRQLAENIEEIFWLTDPDKNEMLYISPNYERVWGRSCRELYREPRQWLEAIHPEDRTQVHEAMLHLASGEYNLEYRIVRPDGAIRWILDRAFPVRDESGKVYRIAGVAQDITQSKAADERLLELATLLDAAHEAILVKDLEDRIIYWNKGAERTYGWSSAEALGRQSGELLHKDQAGFASALAALKEHGQWEGEMVKRHKGGRELIVAVRWTLVRDARGEPRSILAINTDITDKKRLEQHFLRAQRMESIGTLAGGIAHDLNNVLAPILMSVEVLKDEVHSESGQALLATLQNSAQRGADLVCQVLSFARGVEGRRMDVNLHHLLREIQKIIRDTFPKNIEFKLESPKDLWVMLGDPTQMHQVFTNLCVNARDAMPGGGLLTVTLENVVLDDVYSSLNPEARPGPYVVANVTDTGAGIPLEIRDRVFEPFFTTKAMGKGTGLGLSTTLAIVRSHGGFIHLYSELGKGSKFKVCLPAQTSRQMAETQAVEQTRLPRGQGELILVVDDEEGVRTVAGRTLERFGYRVLLATHGAEAVSLYASHRAEIAVVITDMAMPIMDGPATIIALKAINPGVRIIGSSGHASNGGVAKALGAGVQHFVPKPYTAETLLITLQRVLHGTAEQGSQHGN